MATESCIIKILVRTWSVFSLYLQEDLVSSATNH